LNEQQLGRLSLLLEGIQLLPLLELLHARQYFELGVDSAPRVTAAHDHPSSADFVLVFESKLKGEGGTHPELGHALDLASEVGRDLLRYVEPQANPLGVQLLGGVDEAEELEQLLLILFLDAHSIIDHFHLEAVGYTILEESCTDVDHSIFLRELQRIRQQVHNHLLEPLLICADEEVLPVVARVVAHPREPGQRVLHHHAHLASLEVLDAYDFFD